MPNIGASSKACTRTSRTVLLCKKRNTSSSGNECCVPSERTMASSVAAAGSSADGALVLKIRTNFRFFRPRVKSQKLKNSSSRLRARFAARQCGDMARFAAFLLYVASLSFYTRPCAAADQPADTNTLWFIEHYTKYEHLIPMRDGVKLFTRVYVPKDNSQPWPILLTRTPYAFK